MRNKLLSILVLTAALALGGDNRPAWHPVVDSAARLTQLFDKPPAEYSTSPFFVWNGEVTEADLEELLRVDTAAWKNELPDIARHFAQFGDRFPSRLQKQLDELAQRLG